MSSIIEAKLTLEYPLYASDFDPNESSFLLVAGGGGEGRTGVTNKIALLNASRKEELSQLAEIELSRHEDSVTSLAIAKSTKLWGTAFAGINSSTENQEAGRNEHLRSFLVPYPEKRRTGATENATEKESATESTGSSKPKIEALGKVSLFKPSTAVKKETFQRVLRLSKRKESNGPRLGAVATGLAPAGEIVFFKAETDRPGIDDVRGRVQLGEKEEAADVDIVELEEEGKFRVAYCTDYDIYVTEVDWDKNDNGSQPSPCIHGIPHPDTFAASHARPKFRCVRFITPRVLLVLKNQPQRKGSELLLLEISGMVTLRKKLHKKIRSAIALSISRLDASSPSEIDQHAIAVAGADTSITILTLDRFTSSPKGKVKFRNHTFLPSVHPTSITSLTFSTFRPPETIWKKTPPQYLKLASTSIANTCVVHSIPLTPYPSPPKPDTPARYLLAPPVRSSVTQNTFSVLIALFAIAVSAFFLQAFTEIRGGVPEYLGAKRWINERVHGWIARPYMFEELMTSAAREQISVASTAIETPLSKASEAIDTSFQAVSTAASKTQAQAKLGLRKLIAQRNLGSDTSDNANEGTDIIVRHAPTEGGEAALSAELRDASKVSEGEHEAKRWDELERHEKETWKKRLLDAGEWSLEEGETVLKGIFFSGLGQAVGAAVGG